MAGVPGRSTREEGVAGIEIAMATKKASSEDGKAAVEAYLARVPEPARTTLEKMRAMIRAAAPKEATEAISYGIPRDVYKRQVLLLFGLPGRRSRRRALLSGIILLVALASVAACGGGGSGGGGGGGGGKMIPGTPAGVYTISLYAADAATGKVTAQSSFTVTVQ